MLCFGEEGVRGDVTASAGGHSVQISTNCRILQNFVALYLLSTRLGRADRAVWLICELFLSLFVKELVIEKLDLPFHLRLRPLVNFFFNVNWIFIIINRFASFFDSLHCILFFESVSGVLRFDATEPLKMRSPEQIADLRLLPLLS